MDENDPDTWTDEDWDEYVEFMKKKEEISLKTEGYECMKEFEEYDGQLKELYEKLAAKIWLGNLLK